MGFFIAHLQLCHNGLTSDMLSVWWMPALPRWNRICVLCDMIKGNESDVADIALDILAKKESQFFFCFILL